MASQVRSTDIILSPSDKKIDYPGVLEAIAMPSFFLMSHASSDRNLFNQNESQYVVLALVLEWPQLREWNLQAQGAWR